MVPETPRPSRYEERNCVLKKVAAMSMSFIEVSTVLNCKIVYPEKL
jgi:hypothetical protein